MNEVVTPKKKGLNLVEVKEEEEVTRGRAAGASKYEKWFTANAVELLDEVEGNIRVKMAPEEFKEPGQLKIGTTTVQYNLMRLFYAAGIPFAAYTKDETINGSKKKLIYVRRKDDVNFGPSHRKNTDEVKDRLRTYLTKSYPEVDATLKSFRERLDIEDKEMAEQIAAAKEEAELAE